MRTRSPQLLPKRLLAIFWATDLSQIKDYVSAVYLARSKEYIFFLPNLLLNLHHVTNTT